MSSPTVTDLFDPAFQLAEHGVINVLESAPSIEVAARLLVAVQELRRLFAVTEDELHAFLCDVLPSGGTTVDGVGYVAKKKGTTRTAWDHDELLRRVVAAARDERLVNETTGEYEAAEEAVARVIAECAGISYWKVTALRPRGIDVDEFCEKSYGPPKAVIA